ncbi:alpha/beta-hydrolase [Xylaria sp. FL1042]|nr:alpha/beta-hydrolase [Xylaria sp. FL1042]
MATPKPVIVIIHGAFLSPPCYSKLKSSLIKAGFEAHVPQLPTLNSARPPTSSLNEDTEFIRSYVENILDQGHNVIAIMHSYSGQVGTNALTRMSIESRTSRGLKMGHIDLIPIVYDIAEDMITVERSPRDRLLGPWDDKGEVEEFLANLKIWNGNAMYQKIERCAWRETPVAYIYTSKDTCLPLQYQESMVGKIRAEHIDMKTETLATGHSPHVTMPEELTNIVRRIAGF